VQSDAISLSKIGDKFHCGFPPFFAPKIQFFQPTNNEETKGYD